ncbi:MAG TPA: discoidin domain-containing protein [Actinocrinis sp.]|uniref:discoidin domain-containing protein n=1 Tax=Actinocrinis sp. TaxID=1920516 RepID=UPI002DDD4C54|nr:discoidin domain-containing protein [Actinocrinis sp.]HEV2342594.1 discoidin domain-containing protein [Actinocrinis sp.]
MKRRLRSIPASLRRLLILTSVGAVCAAGVTGLTQTPALAAGSPPPAPLNLGINANADSSLSLSWDQTPGATSYHVYRGTAAGGEGATPIATTTTNSYNDLHLSNTLDYFYVITAINSGGESAKSAEDSSRTPPPIGTGGNTPGVANGSSLTFYGKDALLGGFDWFPNLSGWFPSPLGSSGALSPGGQVIDMAYAAEGTMTFNDVVVPTAGLYTVDWRYAFAQGLFPGVNFRNMQVIVNGTTITTNEQFPVTGSFDVYQHSALQVHLNAGKNSITLGAKDGHGISRADELTVTPASASSPSGPTNLTATAGTGSVTLNWTAGTGQTSYSIYRSSTISDGEATTPVATVSGTTTTFTDTGLTNGKTYFYFVGSSNATGVSPDSNEIYTTPGETFFPGTNLALNGDAYASSIQGNGTPASAVTDGSFNSRWSSLSSDPQWLMVDLGATHTVKQVVIYWEAAYAKAFQLEISSDGTNWTTIYSTTTGTGGTQSIPVTGTGRFIEMYGTARGTGYGYSIWELQVFGS